MYHLLFQMDPLAPLLMHVLEKKPDDFHRFRDCHLVQQDDEFVIQVFTRCGGGNRQDHLDMFEAMSNEPNYIRDYDDPFDSTYAHIEFSIPATDKGVELLSGIQEMEPEKLQRLLTHGTFEERFNQKMSQLKEN